MKEHDIKILTPYYNVIETRCERSIYKLLDSEELNCAWQTMRGTNIAYVRNALVNDLKSDLEYQKIDDGFTHYLFIDSDTVVNVEDIKRMLEYDLDIVCGAYKSRESEYCYVGGMFKKQGENVVDFLKIASDTEGLIEVDWVGAGCLLIKKEVLENLPFPWFRYPIIKKEHKGRTHCNIAFEDVGFCMLAKEHGYKIYLDCDCKLDHLARRYNNDVTTDFELLFKNVNDDVNKMCQLIRMMSYRIKKLENKEDE